jgi:hypothetical protein
VLSQKGRILKTNWWTGITHQDKDKQYFKRCFGGIIHGVCPNCQIELENAEINQKIEKIQINRMDSHEDAYNRYRGLIF